MNSRRIEQKQRMKAVFVLLALISVAFAQFSWSSCGTSSDHFKVQSVVMVPYPAEAGENVTVHAYGTQDETVTGGTWTTTVYLDGFQVQSDSGNVCDLIPHCPCPCPAGSYTSSQTLYVSDFAVTDTYTGKYVASDQNGNELSCISYTFQING